MTKQGPNCLKCKHWNKRTIICEAFPNGIPDEIFWEYADHTKPFKGDKGIRFEELLDSE
jgi:hypothetical protein